MILEFQKWASELVNEAGMLTKELSRYVCQTIRKAYAPNWTSRLIWPVFDHLRSLFICDQHCDGCVNFQAPNACSTATSARTAGASCLARSPSPSRPVHFVVHGSVIRGIMPKSWFFAALRFGRFWHLASGFECLLFGC
jgi:hypothetical protein